MAQTISVNSQTVKDILIALKDLKREVGNLREKIEVQPHYGSRDWWKKQVEDGEKEIKAGRYKTYRSAKDLVFDLHRGI